MASAVQRFLPVAAAVLPPTQL
jgi:hypothetical protein